MRYVYHPRVCHTVNGKNCPSIADLRCSFFVRQGVDHAFDTSFGISSLFAAFVKKACFISALNDPNSRSGHCPSARCSEAFVVLHWGQRHSMRCLLTNRVPGIVSSIGERQSLHRRLTASSSGGTRRRDRDGQLASWWRGRRWLLHCRRSCHDIVVATRTSFALAMLRCVANVVIRIHIATLRLFVVWLAVHLNLFCRVACFTVADSSSAAFLFGCVAGVPPSGVFVIVAVVRRFALSTVAS